MKRRLGSECIVTSDLDWWSTKWFLRCKSAYRCRVSRIMSFVWVKGAFEWTAFKFIIVFFNSIHYCICGHVAVGCFPSLSFDWCRQQLKCNSHTLVLKGFMRCQSFNWEFGLVGNDHFVDLNHLRLSHLISEVPRKKQIRKRRFYLLRNIYPSVKLNDFEPFKF